MLSKGKKKSYCCPNCNSPRILKTNKGLVVQDDDAWVTLPSGSWVCLNCIKHGPWRSRVKCNAVPGDIYDGTLDNSGPVPPVQQFIDELVRYEPEKQEMPHDIYQVKASPVKRPEPPIKRGDKTELGVEWCPEGKGDYTHWTHRPDDFGVWVAYNSWRFKDHYDVMLKDGTIHRRCYPNADVFHSGESNLAISEYDIIAVRLCTYEDLKGHWMCSDGWEAGEYEAYRANRNADMFATEKGTTAEDWHHVQPVLFDPETKQLVTKSGE